MKEVEKAGHVMFNADAWTPDWTVVLSVVTVTVSVLVVVTAIRKAMQLAEQERLEKEKKGGSNS